LELPISAQQQQLRHHQAKRRRWSAEPSHAQCIDES
jgi:hypothetical protein